MSYDAIVVGAGHNGLVAAFYLARGGLRVLVVEALPTVGGACKTEELIPGYRFSTCANWVGWWRRTIVDDMGLLDRGLEVGGADLHTRIFPPARPFVWWEDAAQLDAEIARICPEDVDGYHRWTDLWARAGDLFGPYLLTEPPTFKELMADAERRGHRELLEMLLTTSLAEFSDRCFRSSEMRSIADAPHDVGSLYDHGSALAMAMGAAMENFHETGTPAPRGFVRGGMGRITELMREAAEDLGVEVRVGSPVEEIVVEGSCIAGVRLASGEQFQAPVVVSNTDAHRTFTKLLDSRCLDVGFLDRIRHLRRDVAPLKLHCALSGLPTWAAFGDSTHPYEGGLTMCLSREQQEQAWDDARHGRLPDEPFMVGMLPSYWDASLAPQGHHTASFWILFAPVTPSGRSWEECRDEMAEKLLKYISRFSPDFRELLVDWYLLTPFDLEERVLLTDGNIHHVDIRPSQLLWQRPLPELSRYRAPIAGLYLSGAGQHPYGEVSGAPSHNAAHAILSDLAGLDERHWAV